MNDNTNALHCPRKFIIAGPQYLVMATQPGFQLLQKVCVANCRVTMAWKTVLLDQVLSCWYPSRGIGCIDILDIQVFT